jgi:hypothetical protein
MYKLYIILFILQFELLLSQSSHYPPTIGNSTVLPSSIYSTTPIRIVTSIFTNNWSLRVNKSFTLSPNIFIVNLENCVGYGNVIGTAPRIHIDTFKIGNLPAGTYTAYLKSNISNGTTVCNIDTFSTANFTFQVLEGVDPIDVGINESKVDPLNFSFLPNPVFDELEVNFNQQEQHPIHLQLFNLFGQIVYEERLITNETKKKMDVRFLKSGVYYLQFKNGTSELVKKLIKN